MKVTISHNTTRSDAKRKVKRLLGNLAERHSDVVSDVDERWEEDQLFFGFRARGIRATGTLEVTEDEVIVDGRVPLLAKPFEGRIKAAIEKEAKKLFRKA